MTHPSTPLSQHEIERLVEAYFDCLLTRAEESDLRRLLASTPHDSPAIRSARAAMGAEVALRRGARRSDAAPARKHRPWLSVAAAATVLMALGTVATLHHRGETSPSVTVYCHGRAVTDPDEALRLARAEVADSERLMQEIIAAEQTRLQAAGQMAEAAFYSDPRNLRNLL